MAFKRFFTLFMLVFLPFYLLNCTKDDRSYRDSDRPDFYLPNAFGIYKGGDRYFHPVKKTSSPELTYFEMTIYNKDLQVFQCDTTNTTCGWNGKHNGEYVSEGQYYYEIEYRLKGHSKTCHAKSQLAVLVYE